MNYRGKIIEESLTNKDILNEVKIIDTRVEHITERHNTPWLKRWTLHTIEIPEENAEAFAEKLSKLINSQRNSPWYVDFRNDKAHFIVFPDKVFRISKDDKEEYEKATEYGVSIGIPAYQFDFSEEVTV